MGCYGDEVLDLLDLGVLYCRNVFSLFLKMIFCRFVEVVHLVSVAEMSWC